MMMRPRKYSTFNRCVARALSHSINDYYKHKGSNSTYKSSSINENSNNEANVGCAVAFTIVFGVILIISKLIN